jgi:hypothetical protein
MYDARGDVALPITTVREVPHSGQFRGAGGALEPRTPPLLQKQCLFESGKSRGIDDRTQHRCADTGQPGTKASRRARGI